jgi:3-methyladenine DNA glycosylase AlkD
MYMAFQNRRWAAGRMGKDHQLALQLWKSGVYDARIPAGIVVEPKLVMAAQADRRVRDFDNWNVCDGTCRHLFAHTAFAWQKAAAWRGKPAGFQKRAGLLLAYLAVREKHPADRQFLRLLPIIRGEAHDGRNFVRKAEHWALRQVGKRNSRCKLTAIREAERIRKINSAAASWIAADALREFGSKAVHKRLRQRSLKDARRSAA